ncbi:uncharacterized protein C8R40DRAFT_1172716 [Lentinula edodes]|uniref:uncharacterized protein n=1 Tax=Lentinula edodes TaxID=5353 RepID=UPI001E8EA846|nr:uncharacterized protein C8R40DRAFT_1172716 [Lentinula edodes]KAH7873500.1 hypothetical protein C8R40DRAFT_1172716 [Lentinula edodes]
MKTLDVIVVGAGIGGLSTALALAADGRRVTKRVEDLSEAQDALMALGDSEDNPIFWASGVMRDWLFGWEVGAQTRGLGVSHVKEGGEREEGEGKREGAEEEEEMGGDGDSEIPTITTA